MTDTSEPGGGTPEGAAHPRRGPAGAGPNGTGPDGAEPDVAEGVLGPAREPRSLRARALPALLLCVAAAFVALALWRNWTGVRAELVLLSWPDLLASGLTAAAATLCTGLAWRVLLCGLGAHVPLIPAMRVFCVGQLGKYIPGSVWVVAIQAELGRQHRVRRTVMGVSYLLAVAVAIATGGLVGLFALLGAASESTRLLAPLLAVGAVPVLLALVWPGLLNTALGWVAARLGRDVPTVDIPRGSLAGALALSTLGWATFGLHAWLLARPLGGDAGLFLPTVGAFALGYVAGLVLIPLPAGAGVREGVLVAILAGSIGTASALTVALVSRLLLVVVDVVLAGALGLAGRRPPSLQAGAAPDPRTP